MKNKKIASLLVAGALTVGIVGGTLAWLTASDSATNHFKTANGTVNVQVWEKFDSNKALNLEPGATVDKNVQIKNAATNVDQFIRVKINEGDYDKIKPTYVNVLSLDDLKVTGDVKAEGKWLKDGDYYYYIGKVKANGFTNSIMSKVTFSSDANEKSDMEKVKDIVINAESVQASNDAYVEVFEGMSDATKDLLSLYQGQEAKSVEMVEGSTNQGTHK